MAAAVRLNRYVAAAGLGTRREAEGLIRAGRVAVDGVACVDPTRRVALGETVLLDGRPFPSSPRVGVILHRAPTGDHGLVHPLAHVLAAVEPRATAGGLELLLADAALAARLGDARFPLPGRHDAVGRRTGLGALRLGDLAEGAWRPLSPRELQALRRGARLPPSPG